MKKPTKKPQIVRHYTDIITTDYSYTADKLRKIADQMDAENIISVCIQQDYSGCDIVMFKKENKEEIQTRYNRELANYNLWKMKQQQKRDKIIEEAKKLGMKFDD